MSHYHLSVPVDVDDVEIIKQEFNDFLRRAGGITLHVVSDNEDCCSEELSETLGKLFIRLISRINSGEFERLH